jgi:predicted transcriptional regulator
MHVCQLNKIIYHPGTHVALYNIQKTTTTNKRKESNMKRTLAELIELAKQGLIKFEEIPVKRMQEEFCITNTNK